jgi:23S rRNA (cytidine1920-2'-O)/16S rRNA (cytidine1409-2'-O)-methyltransferase
MRKKRVCHRIDLLLRLKSERPDIEDPVAAILANRVRVAGVPVNNPRSLVLRDAKIEVICPPDLRGTRKMRGALASFGISVDGRVVADIGASTGGFTIALLEAGARRVYAVDAGYGQLLGSLRLDPRVVNLERANLGALDARRVPEPLDIVAMDLSYLSLARAVPQLEALVFAPCADAIALVKPMFELGLARPPDDEASLCAALEKAVDAFRESHWRVLATARSPVPGARGAIEWFVHARRRRGVRATPK